MASDWTHPVLQCFEAPALLGPFKNHHQSDSFSNPEWTPPLFACEVTEQLCSLWCWDITSDPGACWELPSPPVQVPHRITQQRGAGRTSKNIQWRSAIFYLQAWRPLQHPWATPPIFYSLPGGFSSPSIPSCLAGICGLAIKVNCLFLFRTSKENLTLRALYPPMAEQTQIPQPLLLNPALDLPKHVSINK